MRRKATAEIVKENRFLLFFPLLLIIAIFLVVLNPYPDYCELKEKSIKVDSLYYYHQSAPIGRFAHPEREYNIITDEGEKYHIAGDYSRQKLEETLTRGKAVKIKWSEGIFFRKHIYEITDDNTEIVTYARSSPNIFTYILGIVLVLISIGCIFIYYHTVKREIKKNKKRDKRIEKKYGKNNKQ